MSGGKYRLLRLMHAQGAIVESLETRLAGLAQRRAGLQRSHAEIKELAERVGDHSPASLPAMLRALTAIDLQLKQSGAEVDDIRRQLIIATVRQRLMSARAKALAAVAERRLLETELSELVSATHSKASRKHGVMS